MGALSGGKKGGYEALTLITSRGSRRRMWGLGGNNLCTHGDKDEAARKMTLAASWH